MRKKHSEHSVHFPRVRPQTGAGITIRCQICETTFARKDNYETHMKKHRTSSEINGEASSSNELTASSSTLLETSTFNGAHRVFRITPIGRIISLLSFFVSIDGQFAELLGRIGREFVEYKVHLKLAVTMIKVPANGEEKETEIFFGIKTMNQSDVEIGEIRGIFDKKIEQFCRLSSGFTLKNINFLDITVCRSKSICKTKGHG